MNIFAMLNNLVPDSVRGAQALKLLRWLSASAGAAALTWLVGHGFSASDAAAISGAIAALVLSGGSAAYSMWDAKNVGKKIDCAQVSTAQKVTAAIAADPAARAQIALAAAPGTPAAAKQVEAILKAGQE